MASMTTGFRPEAFQVRMGVAAAGVCDGVGEEITPVITRLASELGAATVVWASWAESRCHHNSRQAPVMALAARAGRRKRERLVWC